MFLVKCFLEDGVLTFGFTVSYLLSRAYEYVSIYSGLIGEFQPRRFGRWKARKVTSQSKVNDNSILTATGPTPFREVFHGRTGAFLNCWTRFLGTNAVHLENLHAGRYRSIPPLSQKARKGWGTRLILTVVNPTLFAKRAKRMGHPTGSDCGQSHPFRKKSEKDGAPGSIQAGKDKRA